jgi:hypothetical protein
VSGLAACPEERHIKEKSASLPRYDAPDIRKSTGHRPGSLTPRSPRRSSCLRPWARSRSLRERLRSCGVDLLRIAIGGRAERVRVAMP